MSEQNPNDAGAAPATMPNAMPDATPGAAPPALLQELGALRAEVAAAARLWLTSDADPHPAPAEAAACLRVPAAWLARLRPHDRITLTDARAARRTLAVADTSAHGGWAGSDKTCYLVPETVLRHHAHGKKGKGKPVRIGDLPAREQAIVLRTGGTPAAMRWPRCGVMIARGDLAVESGFERLAEVQEEMLWVCEAAHVPVVWATQVLESLAQDGRPSRAEITDAAMGDRAECVMLNKGPHVVDAVRVLDDILKRMQAHQSKKQAMLRMLHMADALPRLAAAPPAAPHLRKVNDE